MATHIQKSRLGLLLIKNRLITPQQLDRALNVQVTTGMRLGEVLIEQGMLTKAQLNRALKKQSRQRLWASILVMVLGPLSFGSLASMNQSSQSSESHSIQLNQSTPVKPLGDPKQAQINHEGIPNSVLPNELSKKTSD